ncbi:hypothetical protein CQ020_11135 [Arthrobacter sp. MYb23]|uniref:hypothetical protein n=1 Tax=unclassified Arthrobacter TaxID=235627 RepID=UPI000CFC6878|nr:MULTISPECIES: hypothetical protein [unclassified Arthrobacter]PRB41610.1 hypothetical protein CQ038_12640 [Arthrobacter sp. MYb51]PRB96040.1 hypothetical protein CQ020_11135 [Arthrobacter sp. MYb23]
MTFFQDFSIPTPPPRPRMPRFTPPPWTAPPRYELPVIVPVGRFVHKSQAFVMAIDAVRVHSTGCVIDLNWILRRTDQDDQEWTEISAVFHRHAPQVRDGGISADSILLLGIQFPDGAKASSSSLAMYGHRPLDEEPDGPVFEYRPKGGNGGDDDISGKAELWLWPLPPSGDLRIVAKWTDMGLSESSIILDGRQLREAAAGAQKYWPEEDA